MTCGILLKKSHAADTSILPFGVLNLLKLLLDSLKDIIQFILSDAGGLDGLVPLFI